MHYVLIAMRTLVDRNDPKDIDQVHAAQDAIRLSQANLAKFERRTGRRPARRR